MSNIDTLKTFFPCDIPPRRYAKKIEMIVSDNDPYITVEEAENMAKSIHASLTIIENAGHISANSGYGKWKFIENLVIGKK